MWFRRLCSHEGFEVPKEDLPTLQVDGRLHVHKGQRHKLCDAAGALLQVTDCDEVARPVHWAVHMAKHDGGRRAEPHLVRRFYYLHSQSPRIASNSASACRVAASARCYRLC